MLTVAITWLITMISLGLATLLLPGIESKNTISFVITATLLGLINATLRPILWLLTAPLSVVTFGIFLLVINALMIKLAAAFVPGYRVNSFGTAFLAAIIMAITTAILVAGLILISGGELNIQSYHVEQYRL
jgi:putative membrane protein